MAKPQLIGTDDQARHLYVLELQSIEECPTPLDLGKDGFALFVACDSTDTGADALGKLAETAINQGCALVAVWGPGCERLHDIFDATNACRNLDVEVDGVLMTTWHEDDPLEEALDYFLRSAAPDEDYAPPPRNWLAVSVGSAQWAAAMRSFMLEWMADRRAHH